MGVATTKPIIDAPAVIKRINYYDDRYYKIDVTPPEKFDKKLKDHKAKIKAKGKKKGKKGSVANLIHKIFKFFPSVTTILDIVNKPYLTNWKATVGLKEASRITGEAMKRGSNVHSGAETLAMDGICIFRGDDQYTNYEEITKLERQFGNVYLCTDQLVYLQIHRVYQFMQTLKLKIHKIEETVYSLVHEYAGTLDLVAEVPEAGKYAIAGATPLNVSKGKYIMDWKSGKSASSPDYLRQLSAYYMAYMEMNPKEKLEGAMLIHTNSQTKTGIVGLSVIIVSVDVLKELFVEFLKIKEVYMIENPTPKYKELDFPEFLTFADKDPYQTDLQSTKEIKPKKKKEKK